MIKHLYFVILDNIFRFCWLRVPWFADYTVLFVQDMQSKMQKVMMQPDFINKARDLLIELEKEHDKV